MEWLAKEEYIDIGESLTDGQKLRVNHHSIDCAGDSSSLLIERKDNGDISAYCFRCGRRGFHSCAPNVQSLKARRSGAGAVQPRDGACKVPASIEYERSEWPVQARVWLRQARLTEEEMDHYGFGYDPDTRRVIVKHTTDDGSLVSWQSRRIFDNDPLPKYLTQRDSSKVAGCFIDDNTICPSSRLVVVEDKLSGIRVGRHVHALVLLGTKLHSYHLREIIDKGYNDFFIWLDDDNLQVKKAQLQLKRDLDKVGKSLIYHSNGVDPKTLSDKEIADVLLKHWQ